MLGVKKSYEAEGFQDSENTLYDTLQVAACRHTFVQTHRLHNTESDPNGNWDCELMTCHCRFLGCNRCVPLVGMLILGKAVPMGGRHMGKLLPLNFAVSLKLL